MKRECSKSTRAARPGRRFAWCLIAVLSLGMAACGDEERETPVLVDPSDEPDAGPSDDSGLVDDAGETPDADENNGPGPDPVPGGGEHVETLIDRLEVQLQNGASSEIEVEVPENTVAMTITVDGQRSEMYGLASWTGPDGHTLVAPNWYSNGGQICFNECSNRIAMSEGTFATIAPNNPEAELTPGTHTFSAYGLRVQGFNAQPSNATVHVTVHAKVLDAEPEAGVLDLNLHFTGARGWTAASAQEDEEFLAILEAVNGIYEQVGIRLGEITWRDVDEGFQVIESVQGADSDLMELFAASEGNDLNAVNLFFVDEIQSPFGGGGGGMILGVAGGIPGPPLAQGTSRSGVAVAVRGIDGGPSVKTTFAHEVGHFLGLFHTTEHFALPGVMPEHDPLPDTPERDKSFLMHAEGSGDKLSPWQGRVMRQNPWVRHPEVQ